MTNKKIASELAMGIILLLAILIGGLFWVQEKKQISTGENQSISTKQNTEKQFCTQEAKICDDGKTYVGRTGPNCEFAQCPK